jgi:hypothetical protein
VRSKGSSELLSDAELRQLRGLPPLLSAEEGRKMAADFCAPVSSKRAPKKSKTMGDAAFEKKLEEVGDMLKSGRWNEATPMHFVALYVDLYYRVYGILPEDLGPKERVIAGKMASGMLDRTFGGDRQKMSQFMAWTWTREKEREQYRRENNKDGQVIGWAFQFGNKLISSYRIAEARKASHGPPSR